MCIPRTPGRDTPLPSGHRLAVPFRRTEQPQPASLSTVDGLIHCKGEGEGKAKRLRLLGGEPGRLAMSCCNTQAKGKSKR